MTPRLDGSTIEDRKTCLGAGARRAYPTAKTAAAIAATPNAAHAILSRLRRRATMGAGAPAAEPAWEIHRSSSMTSCAVCHRSSGSLARQVLTTRSKAGGAMDWTEARGAVSCSRIEAIKDAWLFPVKAFLAVAIS